jgi:3-deoxy-D-manno-octulosonate 8-phosphate phosphatase KdsC-like HAD superfamily phosphatase
MGMLSINETGVVAKSFNTRDFYAIDHLTGDGFKVIFITETNDRVIFAKIKNNYKVFGNCKDKHADISLFLQEQNLTWENVAYIGDSEEDLHCIERCKFFRLSS